MTFEQVPIDVHVEWQFRAVMVGSPPSVLHNRSSNTFAADDIHDPTDSTCILKTLLPNVAHENGRFLLVNADTKTDMYSPITKNYPDVQMHIDISDIADSVIIIEANGKVHMDDDLASGSSLDLDTAADVDYFTKDPLVAPIQEGYNYFEIFGAMNPDTGTRFTKVIDNSGSDDKHVFRITNNELINQTDLDAYAAKITARTIDVLQIVLYLQSMGVHNMGETFTFKYDNNEFTVPSAAYYIVSEKMNMDMATSIVTLSEGLMEDSKYAAEYEKPENYNDSFASEIYETDLVTIDLSILPYGADASVDPYGIKIVDAGSGVFSWFYLDDKVDDSRDMIISVSLRNGANGAITFDGTLTITERDNDGSAGNNVIANVNYDFVFSESAGYKTEDRTITSSDLTAGTILHISWFSNEAAKTGYVCNIQARYHQKRSL